MWLRIYSLYPNSDSRRLVSLKHGISVLYAALWVTREYLRHDQISEVPGHLVIVEGLKLVFSLLMYSWQRRAQGEYYRCPEQDEAQHLENLSERNREATRNTISYSSSALVPMTVRSTIYIVLIAVLYSTCSYFDSAAEEFIDPFARYLAIPIATLCSLSFLQISFSRTFMLLQWQAALLQFCGLFIVRSTVIFEPLLQSTYSVLFGVALFTSLPLVLSDQMYKAHRKTPRSFSYLNSILFSSRFILNVFLFIIKHFFGNVEHSLPLSFSSFILPFVEGARDIAALFVIFTYDAAVNGILTSCSCSLLYMAMAATYLLFSVGVASGCILVLVALATYLWSLHHQEVDVHDELHKRETRYRTSAIAFVVLLLLVALTLPRNTHTLRRDLSSVSSTFRMASVHPNCRRKSTPLSLHVLRTRPYHKFDNVLLIVFFSHSRYNVNLDYYKEVYSNYFPNMVFVGPSSREDAGFTHSYDVILDSYQTSEDFSGPMSYKLAGRAAHHQLYTVLKEYDCGYDGYLWAPFDTLLNVPRLQQFDQNHFWYHSPFGDYVLNPALGSSDANADERRHAPPAKISPDPANNLTETWRGWGEDWWWGEPHVGLEVCMKAYYNVPVRMRNRMAVFTNGMTRLIGGSADTMYIPGRHVANFKQVLGLFLETDCFFEIATPSTLHLVVPLNEPILFIDHWWIWQPPFNASFIRQKWDEGYEVDTFHTFHWGNTDPDGVWRGNHENVADIHQMLAESAKRQGLQFPSILGSL